MAKAPKKTAKKSVLKPARKPGTKAKAPTGSRRGFLWKVLDIKQQKLKEQGGAAVPAVNPEERVHASAAKSGYARFNGPRRRVGKAGIFS